VNPAFVRERAAADVGLVVAQRQVANLVDVAADFRQAGQATSAVETIEAELELQIGDDGEQIDVAAAFSETVDRALDVARAGFDRDKRVGHGNAAVVVRMDADAQAGKLLHDHADNVADLVGQRAAVVSQSIRQRAPPVTAASSVFIAYVGLCL